MSDSSRIAKDYLASYISKSNPIFETFFKEKIDEARSFGHLSGDVMDYFYRISREGKKIRGALAVLGYEMCGGQDSQAVYDVSLAMELVHAGFLVQDDVMDNDQMRRGMQSLHVHFGQHSAKFGESMATIAGDHGIFYSYEILSRGRFDPALLIRATHHLAKYESRVGYGQILDIANLAGNTATEQYILNILLLKSAEYTGMMPLLLGAILSGEKEGTKRWEAVSNYGRSFGWAFQIQDDVLGMYGKTDETGKSNDSDIREGKQTFLILKVKELGTKEQVKTVMQVLGNKNATDEEVNEVRKIVKDSGAYDAVIALGWDYVQKAKDEIPHITADPKYSQILTALVEYMMERTR